MHSGKSIAVTRVQDKPTRLSLVVYRYGVCRISDPVSPLDTGRLLYSYQNTGAVAALSPLILRSCLKAYPKEQTSQVWFRAAMFSCLQWRGTGTFRVQFIYSIEMNCCPEGLVPPQPGIYTANSYSRYDGSLPSWGSAVQPPYFSWIPVTFLTTHPNFCTFTGGSRSVLTCLGHATATATDSEHFTRPCLLSISPTHLIPSVHREHVGN